MLIALRFFFYLIQSGETAGTEQEDRDTERERETVPFAHHLHTHHHTHLGMRYSLVSGQYDQFQGEKKS